MDTLIELPAVKPQIDWDNVNKYELEKTCLHEAGHFVVGEHFNVTRFAEIKDTGINSIDVKRHTGRCYFHESQNSFQDAMIGWAGILAENMFCLSDAKRQNELDSEEPRRLASEVQEWLELEVIEASPTDISGMQSYPHQWKVCRKTAELLRRKKDRVLEVARLLFDTGHAHWSKLSPIKDKFYYAK